MAKTTTTLLAAAALIALGACSKKPKPEDIPPPPVTSTGTETAPMGTTDPATGSTAVPGSREDFLAQVGQDSVYFATDSIDLDGEATSILDKQIAWFKRYPAVRVTIEGHCDERGTREYNLALGERRAQAARNYLASAGVTNPMQVLSYGKERPAAAGSDESAWAQNRRAASVIIG